MGNVNVAPVSKKLTIVVQTLFTLDDWFIGTDEQVFTTPDYFDRNWRSWYNGCCRLSSVRDRNNDVQWTVTGIMNRYSTVSPTAKIGRAVQQECRDRSRMPSSA
eukprot:TRINITY_DN79886_c0_g2_i1.p1 TRINITY_DN79886_c0_g2~~TRINITY_DN79886_c0_g2_i1.p1  ORF type:complete len:104 (+),score=11.13 TRINITY_DN79886_c0_g2_i1:155-466(+)